MDKEAEITDYNILNMIRHMGRNEQWKHIRKLKARGIINDNLDYKVFHESNDFLWIGQKRVKRLSEDEIKDILFSAVKDFYKDKLKLHHEILFYIL